MQFSDVTTNQGIIQEITFFLGGSVGLSDYSLNERTRNVNRWYDKTIGWIMEASNPRFEFDDSKYTTLPVFTTSLVSGQAQYAMDASWFDVFRVDIKASDGTWYQLRQTDKTSIAGGYDQYQTTNGLPTEFDVIADALELHPVPNYSLTGGLKVWANRKGSYFTTADTTTEPGFAPQFHRILSLGAAYDFALSRNLPQLSVLRQEIEQLHREIDETYGERNNERLRITPYRTGYNEAR